MKNIPSLLFAAAFITFLYACQKCKPATYHLTQEQVELSNLKKGSYWIMRDSATGRRDSFVLQTAGLGIYEDPTMHDDCPDKAEIRNLSIHQYSSNQLIDSADIILNGKGTLIRLHYGHGLGRYCDFTQEEKKPIYLSTGKIYYSVITGSKWHPTEATYLECLLNKDSFLIRIEAIAPNNTYTWELERANIIR